MNGCICAGSNCREGRAGSLSSARKVAAGRRRRLHGAAGGVGRFVERHARCASATAPTQASRRALAGPHRCRWYSIATATCIRRKTTNYCCASSSVGADPSYLPFRSASFEMEPECLTHDIGGDGVLRCGGACRPPAVKRRGRVVQAVCRWAKNPSPVWGSEISTGVAPPIRRRRLGPDAASEAVSAGNQKHGRTRYRSKWLRLARRGSQRCGENEGHVPGVALPPAQSASQRGKATIAVGHTILVICRHLLTTGEVYTDLSGDYLQKPPNSTARAKRLLAELDAAGYDITSMHPKAA